MRTARRIQLRDLISDRLLREIHHFLWIEPIISAEVVDAGWSCRDHAWLTALLAHSLGCRPTLFHGEAFFVKARTKRSGTISYYQRPHSWVVVEGVGAIDLSINPDFIISGDHFQIPIKCIFSDQCQPVGRKKVFFCHQGNADVYSRAIEYPEKLSTEVAAIYLIKEAEQFHAGHIQRAAGWIGSPLTVRLDAVYGNPSDLYAALLLHIRAFIEGRAPGLSGLPQEESWRRVADTRQSAIDRACQSAGLIDLLPA